MSESTPSMSPPPAVAAEAGAARESSGRIWLALTVVDITLWFNEGAAFSFLGDASGWQRWLFTGLAFIVGAALIAWMKRLKGRSQWLLSCALALILAGAIGNVIDRLRLGQGVDFILWHWII